MTLAIVARASMCFRARDRRSRAVGLTVALLSALTAAGCRSSTEPSTVEAAIRDGDVVASVDGVPILGAAVRERVDAARATFTASDGTASPLSEIAAQLRAVDELIDEALVSIAAQRAGVAVADDEVDRLWAQRYDARPGARESARCELLVERLALASLPSALPSDATVEAYYRDYVVPEPRAGGASAPPLAEIRERLRAMLGASLRAASRDALQRRLRAEIPVTNDLASRNAGFAWDPPTATSGPSPVSSAAPPLGALR